MAHPFHDKCERGGKIASYGYMFSRSTKPVRTALVMPGKNAYDVRYLIDAGHIDPNRTILYAVECDPYLISDVKKSLDNLGWNSQKGNLILACTELYQFSQLPELLDLAFIDFFGTILIENARWIAKTLVPTLHKETLLCLTLQSNPITGGYIDRVWQLLTEYRSDIVEDFCDSHNYEDIEFAKPTLWLKIILHRYRYKQHKLFTYNDSHNNSNRGKMLSIKMTNFQNSKAINILCNQDLEDALSEHEKFKFEREGHDVDFSEIEKRNNFKKHTENLAKTYLEQNGLEDFTRRDLVGNESIVVLQKDASKVVKRYTTYYEICQDYNLL